MHKIRLSPTADGLTRTLGSDPNLFVETGTAYEAVRDSCKVRSFPVSDYRWETRRHEGSLVALHCEGKYVAYVLKSRKGSVVRVYNRDTKCRQTLKGFVGDCCDLSWSYTTSPALLACVDHAGSLYVYSVADDQDNTQLIVDKYLFLLRGVGASSNGESNGAAASRDPVYYRIGWCPYMPEPHTNEQKQITDSYDSLAAAQPQSENGDDCARLLVLYKGRRVELIFLETILDITDDRETPFDRLKSPADGYILMEEESPVTCASLSPDATALAMGTEGGKVMFYILENLEDIRLAHSWHPHQHKAVDSLCFLDNLRDTNAQDQFWKFALTSCDGNRELKLWNCENWVCISTLRIDPHSSLVGDDWTPPLALTADWTGRYLILSDLERAALYMLELCVSESSSIYFHSISDFPFLQPILDVSVVSISRKRLRPWSPGGAAGDIPFADDDDPPTAEHNMFVGLQALLIAVNPRSLSELEIRIETEKAVEEDLFAEADEALNSSYRDMLSDLSLLNCSVDAQPTVTSEQEHGSPTESANGESTTPVPSASNENELKTAYNRLATASSPTSREVGEILSPSQILAERGYVVEENDEETLPRPVTPVAHTLDEEVIESEGDASDQSDEKIIIQQGHDTLADSVNKMSMELERLVCHVQRQEDEFVRLREQLATDEQSANMREAVITLQEQRQLTHESVSQIMELSSSLEPEIVKSSLNDAVTQMEPAIRNEIAKCVDDSMTSFRDMMHKELQNMSKSVKSKTVTEAIGRAAAEALMTEVPRMYNECFQREVVPSFDRSTRTMFQQLNEIFRKGTQEYIDQLASNTSKAQSMTDETKTVLLGQVSGLGDQINATIERHLREMTRTFHSEMETAVEGAVNKVQESLRGIVHDEVAKAMNESQRTLNESLSRMASYRSQTATPVPHQERLQMQRQLTQLLQQKDYNGAFKQALSAMDLSLVLYVCGKVDPVQLFAKDPCPLQQPVILSLLQQLSADLRQQPELKLKYLQEAITSVEAKNPEVQPHLGQILVRLESGIETFTQSNTHTPFARQARIITMAAKSLKSEQ